MRIIKISDIVPGTLLGRTIYREEGQPLLIKGTALTAGLLKRLEREDIWMIYVEDALSEGIEPTNVISDQALLKGTQTMKRLFDNVSTQKDFRDQKDKDLTYVYNSEQVAAISDLINHIIHELSGNRDALYQIMQIGTVDQYTYRHSVDVAILAMLIGRAMGLDDKKIKCLGFGGILHDIGKAHVNHGILVKNGDLLPDEWEEMKKHPVYGYNVLRDVISLHGSIKQMVLYHHERLDGTGYPNGLQGDEISELVRIISVSDIFNALGSNRHYRKSMTPDKIMDIIYAEAVYKLDRDVIKALLKVVHLYPEGTQVRLSDGTLGIVIESRKLAPLRPLIRNIETNHLIDLMQTLTLIIEEVF